MTLPKAFDRFTSSDYVSVVTLGGWTPGLCSLISGGVLSCGCLAGTYKTWRGTEITIIDGRGPHCECDRHQVNAIVAREKSARPSEMVDAASR